MVSPAKAASLARQAQLMPCDGSLAGFDVAGAEAAVAG